MKGNKKINDNIVVIGSSFFVSMVFLFAQMNQCYTLLDVIVWIGGTLGILIIPPLLFTIFH